MADWATTGYYEIKVVGVTHYQQALQNCWQSRGVVRRGNSVVLDVYLVFEPDNPHDENAVAVISDEFGQFGYLSQDEALDYHDMCDGISEPLTVSCKVIKGESVFYARLDFDLYDEYDDYSDNQTPIRTENNNSDFQEKENMGCLLSLGILFFPIIFGWVCLSPRYQNSSRIITGAWLIFNIWFILVII